MTQAKTALPRVEFTKQMKKDYTILMPNMVTIHFHLLKNVFRSYGYNLELLTDSGQHIIDEGLKYVHNDTCYPALLCIGQMLSALKSGKYDLNKTALIMSQTGGGCRASNYIHLLRRALKSAGMENVPVISLSLGIEKNSGFSITLPMLRKALAALTYGDLLMLLSNQIKPFELQKGESDRLVEYWTDKLTDYFKHGKAYSRLTLKRHFKQIVQCFNHIETIKTPKVKVGIVGEIYVKYSSFANNNLEKFLYEQGCEVMVPGIMGFLFYSMYTHINDIDLYGGKTRVKLAFKLIMKFLLTYEKQLISTIRKHSDFVPPTSFAHLIELAKPFIGIGCKMGEGWLLTAEMAELIENGYQNIICTQPFGCLPNHIVGKGMIRKLSGTYPNSNIVPIDYDPGATKVNQENRIKLMLAIAKEELNAHNSDILKEKQPEREYALLT